MARNKIYFISDLHLGVDTKIPSDERELLVFDWLNEIEDSAEEIYLLGDIFDYWFEYSEVVPKGFILLLGKLKELRLKNIPIYFFTGNHDMWVFDYFNDFLDIPTFRKEIIKTIKGKKFYLAHGDTGKVNFMIILLKIYSQINSWQWCFARIHPNTGIKIMKFFSVLSRNSHSEYEKIFVPEKEILLNFAQSYIETDPEIDYFVFGHRHIPKQILLKNKKSQFINLGDWVEHFTYGVFDGENFELKTFKK
ncbi:MAG: UDP-2,3-diacylglucosamine diphosphatase [Saprospiraceae bacterium]